MKPFLFSVICLDRRYQICIHCYRDDLRYNLGKTTVQEGKKSSSVDLVDLRYSKNTNTAFGYDNMMQVFFKKIDVPFG